MADFFGSYAAIQLDSVSKRYGQRPVVDSVSLSVGEGERFALLGHNGAGKTTLIKLMLGLCQPTRGRVTVRDAPAANSGVANIGYLPESVAFQDAMTGSEVLRFYARLKHQDRKHCEQ